ncbi:MAG: type IV toxin-antitoxin system AbiEi family antitoxin domain-containing protein [Bifidobacteriaceae bacterium]|nr:type IV toxin-antitoxin system AbiEi family antitoxin domain-containing protein [Bifidobacteriaceae bacterium]
MRQNFTGNGKVLSVTVREALWDIAVEQYGYVTTRNAHDLGIPTVELGKLAARGRLQRVSQGLYRFAEWPVSANDALMEAVLWTRDPRAALSHDTALEAYDLSDINPDKIHVTIPVREKTLRRRDMRASLVVHYENLADDQIGWWESIPAVTVATAIDQCIASQVRPDLVLQAIDAARRQGRIDQATAGRQRRQVRGDRR